MCGVKPLKYLCKEIEMLGWEVRPTPPINIVLRYKNRWQRFPPASFEPWPSFVISSAVSSASAKMRRRRRAWNRNSISSCWW